MSIAVLKIAIIYMHGRMLTNWIKINQTGFLNGNFWWLNGDIFLIMIFDYVIEVKYFF